MAITKKIGILFRSVIGELLKVYYNVFTPIVSNGLNIVPRERKVIVSLTSYGRRVSKNLCVTIWSLLKQTYKPDAVILWLDKDKWDDEKLPECIKKMQKQGLTVKYCKDIRSYTKLVPALQEFPNDLIITVDDDLYYKSSTIQKLVEAYEQNPNRIYAHRAHRPLLDNNGKLMPYNDWELAIGSTETQPVFLTGCGGVLYNGNLLHKDVTNEELFMKLSPRADDVWFYFMSVLKKTPTVVVPRKQCVYIPLDNFYQLFHHEARLAASNCKESQNDIQIKNVMQHYNLVEKDLFF
jgi:hypothetical protein